MKILKSQLKRIIKEEYEAMVKDSNPYDDISTFTTTLTRSRAPGGERDVIRIAAERYVRRDSTTGKITYGSGEITGTLLATDMNIPEAAAFRDVEALRGKQDQALVLQTQKPDGYAVIPVGNDNITKAEKIDTKVRDFVPIEKYSK